MQPAGTFVRRSASAADPAGRRHWPARLEAFESGTGLALAAFMLLHTLFAASILLGPEAMGTVARAFEGYYLFGRSYHAPVVVVTLSIAALFVGHAFLALRKAPTTWREYTALARARRELRHADTTLWWWQVVTGAVLAFLAGIHLFGVLAHPDRVDPAGAAEHVWHGRGWLLYAVLLPAAEVHVAVGLYRLAMKWGWFGRDRHGRVRRRLKLAMWFLIASYVSVGAAGLVAYCRLGMGQPGP
jgi:fumarate reductase subunit C